MVVAEVSEVKGSLGCVACPPRCSTWRMRALLGFSLLMGVCGAFNAHAARRVDCQALLSRAMQSMFDDELVPLRDEDVAGLKPIARHPASLMWNVPGPVRADVLILKLRKLMQHVVDLTLSNSQGYEGLLLDFPRYASYLETQKKHIDRLVSAWTDEKTGYVDLGNFGLLNRETIKELAAESYLEELEISKSLPIENGTGGFRARFALPPLKIDTLPLNWSIQLFPDARDGVNVLVSPTSAFHRLSDHPLPIPGQDKLAIYGKLFTLFGDRPTYLPGYHQHIFVRSSSVQRRRPVSLQHTVDVLRQLAVESNGRIDSEEIFHSVATRFNLEILHHFCDHSDLCTRLNSDFVSDYIKLYGDDEVGEWSPLEDGSFEFPDDSYVFDQMFESFCDSEFVPSERGHRLLGWDRLLEFAKKYLADYKQEDAERVKQRFQKSFAKYEGAGLGLTVDARVPFGIADELMASRVELAPLSLKLEFQMSMFDERMPVEDLLLKSMVMGFLPSREAHLRGDLSENHLKVLIHRTEHLLDNHDHAQ